MSLRKISLSLLFIFVANAAMASSMSGGKWNIGLAAGWGSTRTPLRENVFYNGKIVEGYKTKVNKNGFTGGIITDYVALTNKWYSTIGIGLYLDAYTARDNSNKKSIMSNSEFNTRDSLKRNYTMEAALKLGRQISPDLTIYGKLGALYSSFIRQSTEIVILGAYNKGSTSAWGGVIGTGILKQFTSSIRLGLSYDYHHYESLKFKDNYMFSQGIVSLRPQYHQVYFTVSKAL